LRDLGQMGGTNESVAFPLVLCLLDNITSICNAVEAIPVFVTAHFTLLGFKAFRPLLVLLRSISKSSEG
jgi:hypothetical protein